MSEVRPSRDTARRYDLFLREGRKLSFFRYTDQGVTLDAAGIGWTADGIERKQPYENIFSVRLQSVSMPRSSTFFVCTLEFRDGQRLIVTSASQYGLGDEENDKIYGQFIRDFHARIPLKERSRIQFCVGNTEGRQKFLWAMLVVAALFFVGTPIVLLLITGELQALLIAGAGFAFVYPVIQSARTNQPRNYSCEYLPDDLVP